MQLRSRLPHNSELFPAVPVSDHQRPERLYQVTAPVQLGAKLHGGQVVGNDLALAGLPLTEEVGVDRAADAIIQDMVNIRRKHGRNHLIRPQHF